VPRAGGGRFEYSDAGRIRDCSFAIQCERLRTPIRPGETKPVLSGTIDDASKPRLKDSPKPTKKRRGPKSLYRSAKRKLSNSDPRGEIEVQRLMSANEFPRY
jgi:hypothetical protein